MRTWFFLLISCGMMVSLSFSEPKVMNFTSLEKVQELRWKKRIILAYQVEAKHFIEVQSSILHQDQKGIEERKLVFMDVKNPLGMLSEKNRFYLLGLDGQVKLISSKPFSLKRLFSTIDSMPMRMREIEKRGKE